MKARRVVIQIECETDAPLSELRKARSVELRTKAPHYVGSELLECAELTEAPRVNVIRERKPAKVKGGRVT